MNVIYFSMQSLGRFFLLGAFLCAFWASTALAQAIPGQLLIQLKKDIPVERLVATGSAKYGLELKPLERVSASWNIWLVETEEAVAGKALRVLKQESFVQVVQRNHFVEKRALPNDPMFNDQWDMDNTGQSNGVIGADIGAELAWDYTTGGLTALGDTIVVAVVDGGVDLNHEDLTLWKNYNEVPNNGIDDDFNGYIDDFNGWNASGNDDDISADGHGTHVSGTVGAKGNNSIGVCGVNWNVQIMPLELQSYSEAEVVEAYGYAFDMRKLYNLTSGAQGAFVVATNSSFGINYGQPADYPLWAAMYDSMGSVGILSAGATTNFSADIDDIGDIPTSCPSPHLISVTNTTRNDKISSQAGYGATTIDLGAPGTSILSTRPSDNYGNSSGTSMATPHVAGAIALLMAAACDNFMLAYHANPDSMALVAKQYLLDGVDVIDDLDGITVSGGRLNIYNSIRNLVNDYCTNCLGIQASVTPISCNGAEDGAIDITVSDGQPPYIIEWSDSTLAEDRSQLSGGFYQVTVTDDTGCVKFAYINLDEPAVLGVNFVISNPHNTNDGAVSAYPVGGTSPYTYQWNDANSSTSPALFDLEAGAYTLTLIDANGCQTIRTAIVEDATAIEETGTETTVKVYPNPASNVFYADIESRVPLSIEVVDVTGRRIYYSEHEVVSGSYTIDCHTWSSGLYLLRLADRNGYVMNHKIVLY